MGVTTVETINITTERGRGDKRVIKEFAYRYTWDGEWEVKTPGSDEWEVFADGDATEATVRELLRKEYSALY